MSPSETLSGTVTTTTTTITTTTTTTTSIFVSWPNLFVLFSFNGGLTRGDSSSVSSSVKLHHGIMGDRRINPRSNYKSPTIFFRFFLSIFVLFVFMEQKSRARRGGAKYTPPKLNIDIKNDALEHVSPASNLALLDLTRQKSRALKESTLIIQIW